MEFSTIVPIPDAGKPIHYETQIVSIGSCFAANMAQKFDYFQFRNLSNPTGILFHPGAIAGLISDAVAARHFSADDVFFHNGRWHSFDAHSDVSGKDQDEVISSLNRSVEALSDHLQTAGVVLITFGTAWYYTHKNSGKAVANCHKVPQKEFEKRLFSPDEVSVITLEIIESIRSVNPKAQLVFSISPVRHLKDGFVENQQSKAHLISGLHQAIQNRENCHYFPAYEIMMDELRDYRFFGPDMIHPTQTAIDYIWERFADAWISDSARAVMGEVDAIRRGLAHRAFDPESEAHKRFLEQLSARIAALQQRFPHISF